VTTQEILLAQLNRWVWISILERYNSCDFLSAKTEEDIDDVNDLSDAEYQESKLQRFIEETCQKYGISLPDEDIDPGESKTPLS